MNQQKTGKYIAEKRKLQNMTQAQLAEKIGVSDRAVSKWERGLSMPDVSKYEELDKCYNKCHYKKSSPNVI